MYLYLRETGNLHPPPSKKPYIIYIYTRLPPYLSGKTNVIKENTNCVILTFFDSHPAQVKYSVLIPTIPSL